MEFSYINLFSILVALLVSMLLGFLYYGPLFGKKWMAALGKTEEELKENGKGMAQPLVIATFSQFVMAAILSMFIGSMNEKGLMGALEIALMAWGGFVATSIMTNYSFQQTHHDLRIIDAGYWLVVLVAQASVIYFIGSF